MASLSFLDGIGRWMGGRKAIRLCSRISAVWNGRGYVPFRVLFRVCDGSAFDFKELHKGFPGLLSCETLRLSSTQPPQLMTLWRSRQHYEDSAGSFAKQVGADTPALAAFVESFAEPVPGVLKRIPWMSLAPWVVAALGWFFSVRGYYDQLFARPGLKPSIAEPSARHLTTEKTIDLVVHLANAPTAGEATTKITKASLRPVNAPGAPPVDLDVTRVVVPVLKPGESTNLTLACDKPLPDGAYKLNLDYTASAGFVSRLAPSSFHEELTIASYAPYRELAGKREWIRHPERGIEEIRLHVRVGQACTSLFVTATLASDDAFIEHINSVNDEDVSFFPADKAISANFNTGSVKAFTDDKVISLYLRARPGRTPDWEKIREGLTIAFSERGIG